MLRMSDGVMNTYVDNELVATDSITITESASNTFLIGKRAGWLSRNANMTLEELQIFDRVLTGAEKHRIQARGANYSVELGRGLRAKYRFTGGSLADSSGNGNDLVGSAFVAGPDADGVEGNARGTSGYAYRNDLIRYSSRFSIPVFFKASAYTLGTSNVISIGSDSSDNNPSMLLVNIAGLSFQIYRGGNYYDSFAAKEGWNWAIVSTAGLVVNGKVISTTGFSVSNYNLYIGRGYSGVYPLGIDEVSVIDKFLNDALQDCGVVVNDNIKFYKHMIATVKEVDKLNPRIEIIVEEIE
jgi:hypothetical protein